MAIDKIVNTKPNEKQKKKPSLLKYLFSKKTNVDLSKYDPYTGDKVAQTNHPQAQTPVMADQNMMVNASLAKQELLADARRSQDRPADWFHALKAGTVGTSGGFVISNLLGLKGRAIGLTSLGLGGLIAGMDIKRQIGNYNKQMAARELIAGKRTPRTKAYLDMLSEKYNLRNNR